MQALDELPEQERDSLLDEARYRLGRERPGVAVMRLMIGAGIPMFVMVAWFGVAYGLTHSEVMRYSWFVVVPVVTAVSTMFGNRYQRVAIEKEARRLLEDQ